MKNLKSKNYLIKLLCSLLILCLSLTLSTMFTARAADDDDEIEVFEFSESVQSEHFAYSGSVYPSTPSGWTGEYVGDAMGSVVSGVIALDSSYTRNIESIKLNIYPEYKSETVIPKTPFGVTNHNPQGGYKYFEGSNKNVLMINTNKSTTAYAYTSSSITLSANSYYKFSTYVKTGFFDTMSGAAFSVTGLKDPVGIWNIDTVSHLPKKNGIPELTIENFYGFEQYTIYIATGPNSETATMRLSVGDNLDKKHSFVSDGYAFFDEVSVYKLSPTNYRKSTEGQAGKHNVCFYDMNPTGLDENGNPIFPMGTFENGRTGWDKIDITEKDKTDEKLAESGWVDWGVYNGGGLFIEKDAFGMEKDPYTPTGKYEEGKNILVLSSYIQSTDKFANVSGGIKSTEFTVAPEEYYLLSFWYNTENVSGNTAAVITGEGTTYSDKRELNPVAIENLSTDSNTERYGWQRASFYIRGSLVKPVKLSIELWLGYKSKASGIVMFSDFTLTVINHKDFTENKYGGTIVTIDNYASESTISNGLFSDIEYPDDEEDDKVTYPAKPSNWTFLNTHDGGLGTTGHSSWLIPCDDAVHGVVPTEKEHYENHRADYNSYLNPRPYTEYVNKNVLLLGSETKTAFGYKSETFTVSANQQSKVTVNLWAELEGYGACLILKNGSRIISSIEQIKDTRYSFNDYVFYVEAGDSDMTLALEIWFGMTDKNGNSSKQTKGHMFINSVDSESCASEEFTEKATAFDKLDTPDTYSVFRTGSIKNFTAGSGFNFAYDKYMAGEAVKDSYDMTLTSTGNSVAGVISTLPYRQSRIPDYYREARKNSEYSFDTALYLENINPGYSKFSSVNGFSLQADSFYRIDFSVLVDLKSDNNADYNRDKGAGAGIWLSNSYGIEDIRDTYEEPGYLAKDENGNLYYEYRYEFRLFSFYYATSTSSEIINWYLTLGDNKYPNQAMAGRVFLNSLTVVQFDGDYSFDEEINAFKNDEDKIKMPATALLIDRRNTETPTEEDTEQPPLEENTDTTNKANQNSNLWLSIPSLIFGIAILIVLAAVVIKKLMSRRPRNRNKEKVVSYDRRRLLQRVGESDDETIILSDGSGYVPDATFESFDDDYDVKPVKTKKGTRSYRPEPQKPLEEPDITSVSEVTEVQNIEEPAAQDQAPKIEELDD